MSTSDKNDRSRVQYQVASERMPLIPDERMTPEQKKAAAELAAGPRGRATDPHGRMKIAVLSSGQPTNILNPEALARS